MKFLKAFFLATVMTAALTVPVPLSADGDRDRCADPSVRYRYDYVSLNSYLPPEFASFSPVTINDKGLIHGIGWACDEFSCTASVLTYLDGDMTIQQPGAVVYTANQRSAAGSMVLDPDSWIEQAALFNRHGEVELIPRLPGELTSHVLRLSDSGIALVESLNENYDSTIFLYRKGKPKIVSFPFASVRHLDINDRRQISGTHFDGVDGDRGFRMDPFSGETTELRPLPTEKHSWAQGINKRGEVLGYSFFRGLERIGVWDRKAKFKSYFVEGTLEYPNVSNRLLWNDSGLIVITNSSTPEPATSGSFLVPKPSVRLDIGSLVNGGLQPWVMIADINNKGDLIGEGGSVRNTIEDAFLLKRTGRCVERDNGKRDNHH